MIHIKQHTAERPRLARWPNKSENGMLLEPLFPHFAHDALSKLDVPYTTRIVDLFQPFVSAVKVLDLYKEGQSVKSTFLCDIVESKSSCALSKQSSQIEKLEDFLDVKEEIDWYNFQVCQITFAERISRIAVKLFDELVTTASSHNILRNRYISRCVAQPIPIVQQRVFTKFFSESRQRKPPSTISLIIRKYIRGTTCHSPAQMVGRSIRF